jgi:hypothetical protein
MRVCGEWFHYGAKNHDNQSLIRMSLQESKYLLKPASRRAKTGFAGAIDGRPRCFLLWKGKRVAFLKRLRTIPWFVRLLVGLFMVAQLAGVVSSPRASALPATPALASQSDNQQMHGHAEHGKPHDHHHHDGGSLAGTCCGLHACFAGVLPPLAATAAVCTIGEPIAAMTDDLTLGLSGGRLDRPPRPLH